MDKPINREIKSKTYAPEIFFPVYSVSLSGLKEFDPSENKPIFVLVYRYDRQVSENEYIYIFEEARNG